MREDIAFDANGTALRGWLYLPEGATRRCSAVVMAHVFFALKEMGLDDYAEVFAAAGLTCLVYDQPRLPYGHSSKHWRRKRCNCLQAIITIRTKRALAPAATPRALGSSRTSA